MAAKQTFEKTLQKLEKIVEELESGDATLEEALKKYEEGVRLSRSCQEELAKAEQKIELLSRNPDGSYDRKNMESGDAAEPEAKPRTRSAAGEDEEGDLLI